VLVITPPTPPTFGDYLTHLRRVGITEGFPSGEPAVSRPKSSRTTLAADAGIGVGYLIKLEQGKATNPSPEVVDKLARALGTRDVERQHLHDLAAGEPPTQDHRSRPVVTAVHREYADNLHPQLAGYVDEAWNVLYANAEYARIFREIVSHGNVLVWFFAARQSRQIMVEWETEARLTVAWLRSHMGRRPGNKLFTNVLEELARYPDFVRMWERRELLTERHQPDMLIRDLDRGEQLTLLVQVFHFPDPEQPLQFYLGTRKNPTREVNVDLTN